MSEIEFEICPICGNDIGHKIDCPMGCAFTTEGKEKQIDRLLSHISTLSSRVEELQFNLDEMVKVASDQTEAWREEHKKLEQAESRLKKLQEAVDRHKWVKWGYADSEKGKMYQVDSEVDEELYKARDEK